MSSDITKLPQELLALIFEHLTKANDRRRAAQVCKLFYDIIRHQSTLKQDNMLRMTDSDSEKSPIRVFENSAFFPFSKLCIEHFNNNITLEAAFWSLHGQEISEIIFIDKNVNIVNILPILNDYFPNLKKLIINGNFSKYSDTNNSENISLPIEDLSINICHISVDQTVALLRCSPLLKNLYIKWIKADHLPQILPWLETIDNSQLNFEDEIPIEKLIYLPSKVVISKLTINVGKAPKTIHEFFKDRTIETLILHSKVQNEGFYGHGEENVDVPPFIYFNREQVLAIGAAKCIKNVSLRNGTLEFEGSLDLLSQLPGLESISLEFVEEIPNTLNPFYWSLPGTAQKIRTIYQLDVSNLDFLVGLNSVTSIFLWNYGETKSRGLSSDQIQTLIRNCPNLTTLLVQKIDVTDADLIGHEDLLPISSLEKLETLFIENAPNITSEAFKSAFKFPNLKSFDLRNYNSSEEEPFGQDIAKHFTQNCPNLVFLRIYNCPITEEGFDILVRHLPYIKMIRKRGKKYSLSEDKVEKMQQEFPSILIYVD